jgi:hypothetical protein
MKSPMTTFGVLPTTSMRPRPNSAKMNIPISTFGLVTVMIPFLLVLMVAITISFMARTVMTTSASVQIGRTSTSTETTAMMTLHN